MLVVGGAWLFPVVVGIRRCWGLSCRHCFEVLCVRACSVVQDVGGVRLLFCVKTFSFFFQWVGSCFDWPSHRLYQYLRFSDVPVLWMPWPRHRDGVASRCFALFSVSQRCFGLIWFVFRCFALSLPCLTCEWRWM